MSVVRMTMPRGIEMWGFFSRIINTSTILVVPYYRNNIIYPKTLFKLLRPGHRLPLGLAFRDKIFNTYG